MIGYYFLLRAIAVNTDSRILITNNVNELESSDRFIERESTLTFGNIG